ncbi:SWIM zinc finger family protein [Streptomyces misionensis]|uniref:SWIM zinc finger family protein n=1 Tax=Streptomyces misionensis TaxID=67331 RepID=UPI0033D1B8FB
MTPTGAHPADLARQALREARRRARTGPEERASGGVGDRPASAAEPQESYEPAEPDPEGRGEGPGEEPSTAGDPAHGTGAGPWDAADRAGDPDDDSADPGDAGPGGEAGTEEAVRLGGGGRPDGAGSGAPAARRPADAARAALRAATDNSLERPEPQGEDRAPEPGPSPDRKPAPGPAAGSGPRPGDAAREALRAARREASRAEAEAGAGRAGHRGARRPPGAVTARTASPSPAPSGAADETARAARLKAAGEMRHFLRNAFRLPPEAGAAPEEDAAAETTPAEPVPAPPDPGASAAGAVPHVPPTMGTPHRDGELRRTFPAFAPRAAGGGDAAFAATWWGNAWTAALERGALDAKRVARGRGYADQGHVDAITVTPGLVLAYVRGSRPRPYRVQVRVRPLADEEWERFLDAAADRPGHIAALLDKELPQSLADCGVPLLPGPGDLVPRCSCPDSGHPCKHAAALCYQTARLLDADPFVLLLLRGRGERELLDALSRRNAARAARAARERQPASLPGIRASEVLAAHSPAPLPPPLPVPAHPEQPPAYPAAPGGPDPFALDQLATDAAARAHALLATGRDPVGELSPWQDAVRLAAARPGSGLTVTTRALYATLAAATGRTPGELARAVAAWRQGGVEGLAVLEEPWDPPAGRFDRARPLLLAADLPAFRPWRNRLTHPHGHVQLRLGRDGLWYGYESEPGQDDWWPRGTPDPDPVGALTGLATTDEL